jgi:Thiamine pyrophosphate enzyme, N-terminal TPP binding domain
VQGELKDERRTASIEPEGLFAAGREHHCGHCLPGFRPGLLSGLKAGNLAEGMAGENSASVSPQPTAGPGGDQTTSDILVETLIAWGATHVFGLVGDGIAGLIEAVRKREDQIQYVGVRHEEAAAFMASGYAKLTGKLGVCLGTTGRVPCICSMASTTPPSTVRRSLRSPA